MAINGVFVRWRQKVLMIKEEMIEEEMIEEKATFWLERTFRVETDAWS